MSRGYQHPQSRRDQDWSRQTSPPLFDPQRSDEELLDALAEQQADQLDEINANQLRRFFGDVKEQYRQYLALVAGEKSEVEKEQLYRDRIAARFKMLRSKVAYAGPKGRRTIKESFVIFLDNGIKKVTDHTTFERFVLHFEAVVGFMYGNGKVKK
jgi:CRISPR-associated protein Csm2